MKVPAGLRCGSIHVRYGSDGPTSADRVTPLVAKAFAGNGFVDAEVRRADHGIGVTAQSPERA